jgi:hypothetical protein
MEDNNFMRGGWLESIFMASSSAYRYTISQNSDSFGRGVVLAMCFPRVMEPITINIGISMNFDSQEEARGPT